MHNRQTRRGSLCILMDVFVATFTLMAGCAHQTKSPVIPNWTGLSASQPPTTPNGIKMEWQTLRPIYRYDVSTPDTSGCPPAPWGTIKAVYRVAPWGKIRPVYRATSPNPAPTKTGAIEPRHQRQQSSAHDTIHSWDQLRTAYHVARTDSTSRPVRGATWGELKDQYR
jgi:hypothetical protein